MKDPVCGAMSVEAPSDRGDPQPALANRSTQRPQAASARRMDVVMALVSNERVKGIEPSYAAWEAAVLPLNYTRGKDFGLSIADR